MTWITVSWLCAVCKQFLLLVVRYIKLIYSWSVHPARQMKTHNVTVTVRSALWVQSKFAVTLPTVTKLILISYSQDGFNWSTHLRYQPMMMMTKLVSCQWPGRACKLTIHSAVAYRLVCTYDFVLPWRKVMWSVSVLSHKHDILSGLLRIPSPTPTPVPQGLAPPLFKSWIRPCEL